MFSLEACPWTEELIQFVLKFLLRTVEPSLYEYVLQYTHFPEYTYFLEYIVIKVFTYLS